MQTPFCLTCAVKSLESLPRKFLIIFANSTKVEQKLSSLWNSTLNFKNAFFKAAFFTHFKAQNLN